MTSRNEAEVEGAVERLKRLAKGAEGGFCILAEVGGVYKPDERHPQWNRVACTALAADLRTVLSALSASAPPAGPAEGGGYDDGDDLHFAIYAAAYAILRDYDNHPDKDRGLIRAGDYTIPKLIASTAAATIRRNALSTPTGEAGEAVAWRPTAEELANCRQAIAEMRAGLQKKLGDNPALWSGLGEIAVDIEWLERVCDHFDAHPPVLPSREEIARVIDPWPFQFTDSDTYNPLAKTKEREALAKADAILAILTRGENNG